MSHGRKAFTVTSAFVYDKKGRLLAAAQNNYHKTHPLQAKHAAAVGEPEKIYLHAEIAALIKCDWKLAHRIVVTRYHRQTGEEINAAPCPICRDLIKQTNIKVIAHT